MFNSKKVEAGSSTSSSNINTLIGEGCHIKGGLVAKNSIKIEGTVQGDVQVEGNVIIGEKGLIQGNIQCSDLIIFGRLEGNINTRQLQLKPSAKIQGDIEVHSLQVDPGASYQGSVVMKSQTNNPAHTASEANKTTAKV